MIRRTRPAAPRRPRRPSLVLIIGLGLGAVALAVAPAAAQTAAALGKPLPAQELPVGTVSVKVIAGSPSSPIVGTDVTLMVNGTPRQARTDAGGRAMFPGLPVGATVTAKVLDTEDKSEHASEEFAIPGSSGVRLLISTKPFQPGAGGAPFAGGAGGMPNPRALSGEARGDQADPPGMLTVHVTYDDFKDSPAGVPVTLVGYAADDTISSQVQNTDSGGRAKFTDLDRSGGTSYFAMALLPRNGGVDRLMSTWVLLSSQVGERMVLSSEKRDSKAPPIDDVARNDKLITTPAGKVRAVLLGNATPKTKVTLVDVATRKVLSEARPESAPDPTRVQAQPQFSPDPNLPAGTLDVQVLGGPGNVEEPLSDLVVLVMPASSNDASHGQTAVTGADGSMRMTVPVSEPQKAVLAINGNQLVAPPMDLSKSGGKLVIRAHWPERGLVQALLDAAGSQGQVVYAECEEGGQHYRSLPFQLIDAAGATVTAIIFPRVQFQFMLESLPEDEKLLVSGKLTVTNFSWAPYRGGPDGLLIPLPRGFTGAGLSDSDQADIAIVPGQGYKIIRPLPPLSRSFRAGFYLPVDAGRTEWALDLPLGAFQSQLVILKTPTMTLQLPPGAKVETRPVSQGEIFIVGPIKIPSGRSMVMAIDGLPSHPRWQAWVRGIVGVLVVGMMLAGLGLALAARRRPAQTANPEAEARRQRLLDELVELERAGAGVANPRRREQVLAELEQLWG